MASTTPGRSLGRGSLCAPWSGSGVRLGRLQPRGLLPASAPVVLQLEAEPIALVGRVHARGLDGRGVHEHVLAALVGGDEAETLRRVEELDRSSLSHEVSSLPMCVKWADSRGPPRSVQRSSSDWGEAALADGRWASGPN